MPIRLKDIDKDALYTVEEVAAKTKLSEYTIKKYCRDKTIKAVKAGRTWLISGRNLLEFFGLGDSR